MQPQFPGMNPYLENPELWSEVHFGLIAVLARSLNAVITPKYRAAVEKRVYEDSKEQYSQIREVGTGKVVTVVEVLSPKNKRSGEGRVKYDAKRQAVLNSSAHLVEIDLLRTGEAKPMAGGIPSDYRILVSRANRRPAAELYPFNLRDSLPRFLLPLHSSDREPIVDLQTLLEQVYQEAALELAIDYSTQPIPPLSELDFQWIQSLL
jgi:Protein of unknown function (DUF4058)